MTRFLIFSDTHGRTADMVNVLLEHDEADYLIHLGDCEADLSEIPLYNDRIKILSVSGNCDFASITPTEGEIVKDGVRIFYTHGHKFSVKHGYDKIYGEGIRRQAKVILFGHTHTPFIKYEDGIYLFNPGSISRPREGRKSYGIMDIVNGQVALNTVKI